MSKATKVGFIWVALSKAEWVRGGSEAGPRGRDGPVLPEYLHTI